MPAVSKQVIEEVRARIDIVELIGTHLTLKRAGSRYKALCPFHKEKTPSFQVNPERQMYYCFGCHAGGDVFRFLMEYEGLTFMMALRTLAERAGVRLSFEDNASPYEEERDLLVRVNEEAAAFYHRILMEHSSGEPGRAYLARRALTTETASSFRLGYAPDRWDTIAEMGKVKGFAPDMLERAGLLSRSEKKGRDIRYDRFRGRLMIPLRDGTGRIVAFSGRLLQTKEEAAKYINTPETALFRKGRMLFALDRARHAMLEQRTAILCEGQLDAIRCHEAGITNTVACQGTAFTEEHARLLKRYVDEVLLVLDADRAGEQAALRAASFLLAENLNVGVVGMPPGEDPDSLLVREGADTFRKRLQQVQGPVDFLVDIRSRDLDLSRQTDLLRATGEVLDLIRHASGAVLRDRLLACAAARLSLREEALRADLERGRRRANRRPAKPATQGADAGARMTIAERALAEHLLHHPETAGEIRTHLPIDDLSSPVARLLMEALLEHCGEAGWSLTSAMRPHGDEVRRFAAGMEMSTPRLLGGECSPLHAARDLLLRVGREVLERERGALAEGTGGEPPEEIRRRRLELAHDINVMRRGNWDEARLLLHGRETLPKENPDTHRVVD